MIITVPAAYDADASILKSELKSYLGTGLVITSIDQADMATTVGVITAGATPAVDARAGWRNPALTGAATRFLGIYHGGVAREVGIPWGYLNWGSLPATGDVDERYRVADLQTLVSYRDATTDALLCGTGNELAGWHPMAGGYALFDNQSGATINQGEAVELDVSVSPTRRCKKAATEKSPSVIGVAMHTVATGSKILVALLGCQDVVQVAVDPTLTVGGAACPVDKGDVLVVGTTAGVARSGGPRAVTPHPAAGRMVHGTPLGAFAVALKDRAVVDGSGLVPARLLPFCGTGETCYVARVLAFQDLTPSGGFNAFFPGKASTGNNGQQAGATESLLISTKHSPIVSAGMEWHFTGDSGTSDIETAMLLSKDTNANVRMYNKRYGGSDHVFVERAVTPCGSDSQARYSWSEIGGAYSSITVCDLYLVHYTH